ncbi:Arylacetamide deacetylase [Aphelenchoides bicaudatus]|nr:Arylacetamide deacetylase [Aphelenchoides bicaudatus]
MFVLLEAGRFLYGDILVDLIASVVYPDGNLRLKAGLERNPNDLTSWFALISGMSIAVLLLVTAILFLLASALHISLPYELCDRQKVQFFEFALRISNEYLGNAVEFIAGARVRNQLTRFLTGFPYLFQGKHPSWCTIRTEYIGGTKCRVYLPDNTKRTSNACIIFIHGGGWCIMRARYYDGPMLSLIRRTGTPIISIDYQLSPDKQFPSAIHECENVVKEVYERKYEELQIDREKIILIGDSAGGNLTAVICQRLLRAQCNYVKCQILVYPVIHCLDFLAPSHQYYYRSYNGSALLNPPSLARWTLMYLGIEATRKNIKLILKNRHLPKELSESRDVQKMLDYYTNLPESFVCKSKYTKPLPTYPDEELAKKMAKFLTDPDFCPILGNNLEGLPPALIMTAGVDILRDEGVLYSKRLKQFNVPTKWLHYESAFHGVMNMPGSKQRTQMLNDIQTHLSSLQLL